MGRGKSRVGLNIMKFKMVDASWGGFEEPWRNFSPLQTPKETVLEVILNRQS